MAWESVTRVHSSSRFSGQSRHHRVLVNLGPMIAVLGGVWGRKVYPTR